MRIMISKNSHKAFDLLGKVPFPWFQFMIEKRKSGQIAYIWLFFLNITIVATRVSIERNVKKYLKQGYMPSFDEYRTAKFVYWPKNKGV